MRGEVPQGDAGEDAFPASKSQQQLYFVQSALGSAPTYHVPIFLRADGPVDIAALRRAVDTVIGRHEALRTRFRVSPTGLLQIVDHDFVSDWSVETDVDDITAWMRAQVIRPFDLQMGPLFRAAFADRGATGSVLSLCFHHAVCDGWSVRVVVGELAHAYRDLLDGAEPKLPEVDYQFGDYALWHNEWLESESAERQLRYWETALAGDLPVLDLPRDVPPGAVAEGTGRTEDWALPVSAVRRLRAQARASGGTPFASYLAAYQVVLGSRCGLADVIVGVPALNRTRPEFRDTVGCFVNMVAVRTDLSAAATFADLVAQVRATALHAQDNQEVPFDLVVRRVNPPRVPGVEPIVQAAFTLGDTAADRVVAGPVSFTPLEIDSTTAKFPVALQVNDVEDRPTAELEYRADRYSPQWARDLAAEYTRVIELAAEDPYRPLSDFFVGARPTRRAPAGRRRQATRYAQPRDDVERALAEVWAEVLGRPRIGIDDNFFEAGGDSIRVVQLAARAAQRGVAFEVRDLLRHQSIRELAAVTGKATGRPEPGRPELEPFALVSAADRALLPVTAVDAYPLAALQIGMLYHGESTAMQTIYHDVLSARVRLPAYSPDAWRAAVRRLTERHELLRTSFEPGRFSEPLQVVHAAVEPPVTFEDARGDDGAVARRMRLESQRPFDLTAVPLVRFCVQRLSEDTVQLWTVLHHAVFDGWSERLLFGELLALYLAELGRPVEIAPPPRARYRSFVALERAAAHDARQLAFWRDRLVDHVVTRVPAGPDTATPDMAVLSRDLPDEVTDGLAAFAAASKVPLRIVLLALHLRVLSLLSGEDDVLTGVVYNGRVPEPDGDRVVGLFLNTLPFRLTLGGGSWTDLVTAVMAEDVEIQSRQRVPLSTVQREAGGHTLFEVFFNYTHFHNESAIPGDVEVLGEESSTPTHFLLGAEFQRDAATGTLNLSLRYDAARVPPAEAARFHAYYGAAARALLADPHAPHAGANLLSQREATDLVRWNDTARGYAGPFLLHRLVEEQVRRTPQTLAVVADDVRLTYAQLDAAANVLTHRLVGQGVRRGDRVAVALRRRAGLVVAVLAVLKSGAAYVPIDPQDPRTGDQLADADVRLALADAALPGVAVEAVPPDADLAAVPAASGPAAAAVPGPARADTPADPAYLIFTSGSTGRPKGVVVSHRAIANRLLWMQEEFGLTEGDRVLQKTPITFDVSVWELFWPLIAGARLVIARPEGHRDPDYLVEVVRAEGVTVLHFVPSMLRAFVAAGGPARCPGLRLVVSSGEALPRALYRDFAAVSGAELANLYGPTEAAVDVTSWRCRPGEDDDPVPIGRPIANVRVHVLDRRGRVVPVGVPGELHVAGVALADGYHGRPELTADRFITHTWPDGTTERLYRTGDRVRWRADGVLEYLGREDGQIKIRGMRVELGEVEATLTRAGASRAVAVVPVGERLVAYVVPTGDGDIERLRQHATAHLPRHMVPDAWVPMPALPVTRSGKLDRRALPPPGDAPAPQPAAAPRTPTERAIEAIWAEVLGVPRVGVDVPFTEAGGHSLAALRLVARLRHRFGAQVTVADLLARDTVRALAASLDEGLAPRRDEATVVRLRDGADLPAVWLFHPVGGNVLCYRPLAGLLPADRPLRAVVAGGLETGLPRHHTVAELAAHYVDFLDPDQPAHLFGWSFGAVLAHEVACLLHERGLRRVSLTMLDAAFPDQVAPTSWESAVDLLAVELAGASGADAVGPGTADERLASLAARAGTGLDPAQLRARARLLQTNLAAHRAHRPRRYPGVAHYLHGQDGRALRSDARWAGVVDTLHVHDLAGGHYELLGPPYVAEVAAVLQTALQAAERSAEMTP